MQARTVFMVSDSPEFVSEWKWVLKFKRDENDKKRDFASMRTVVVNNYSCSKFKIISIHVYKIQNPYFSDAYLLSR